MKKNFWRLWPLLLILPILVLGGCSWLDQLQAWKNGDNQEEIPESNDNTINEPLEQPSIDGAKGTRDIVLFFATSDGQGLKKEIRTIPKNEGVARDVINELIKGPADSTLFPTIPASTVLEDINIKDGVCIVDFSSSFLTDSAEGAIDGELMLYSLVDSLTQFPTISEVRILVNGEVQQTMIGGIDLSQNLTRNEECIVD